MRCGGAQGGSLGCGPCPGTFLQPSQRPAARCCWQSAAWQPWVTQQHAGLCPWQHVRRRRAVHARQSSIAPNMPLPGDDQAAVVFSALSELEGAADAAAGALRRESACASCPACNKTCARQVCLSVSIWCVCSMRRQSPSPGLRFGAFVGHTKPAVTCPVAQGRYHRRGEQQQRGGARLAAGRAGGRPPGRQRRRRQQQRRGAGGEAAARAAPLAGRGHDGARVCAVQYGQGSSILVARAW